MDNNNARVAMARFMAFMEQKMDSGEIPWVAPDPAITGAPTGMSRIPVPTVIMEELGLKVGQTVNKFILDLIFDKTAESAMTVLRERAAEGSEAAESMLDIMESMEGNIRNSEEGNGPTKH